MSYSSGLIFTLASLFFLSGKPRRIGIRLLQYIVSSHTSDEFSFFSCIFSIILLSNSFICCRNKASEFTVKAEVDAFLLVPFLASDVDCVTILASILPKLEHGDGAADQLALAGVVWAFADLSDFG